MTDIAFTPLAERQAGALKAKRRVALDEFLDRLSQHGCAAITGIGGYRLSGDVPVSRLCCQHLYGDDRCIVAFEPEDLAVVIMIGPHNNRSGTDIYAALWEVCGLEEPPDDAREKPDCCEDGGSSPNILADDLDEIFKRTRQLARRTT